MKKISLHDTIVAISTPVGDGGIGIVRLSGPDALAIADKIFKSKNRERPSDYLTYTTHYGHIVARRRIIDEVILTVMRAPKTYTREDIVEINCHGGIVPLRQVLELALSMGARLAEPGEFTRRAFLNGRIDLAQAEAVLDVIRAKTDSALRAAVSQLDGRLSNALKRIEEELLDIAAILEAAVDFSGEYLRLPSRDSIARRLKKPLKQLKELLATAQEGRILREGIVTVICGRPNVGKSSLMNTLLRTERVIVTPLPGTTRDAVEDILNIRGIPLRIVDTAGIIESRDLVERHGVERSRQYLRRADLALFVLDNSRPLSREDRALARELKGKKIVAVVNKCDLKPRLRSAALEPCVGKAPVVRVSALKGEGIATLEKALVDTVLKGGVHSDSETVLSNVRHIRALSGACSCLEAALESLEKKLSEELISTDVKAALDALGNVTGRTITGDILERIFSEFCIGK